MNLLVHANNPTGKCIRCCHIRNTRWHYNPKPYTLKKKSLKPKTSSDSRNLPKTYEANRSFEKSSRKRDSMVSHSKHELTFEHENYSHTYRTVS